MDVTVVDLSDVEWFDVSSLQPGNRFTADVEVIPGVWMTFEAVRAAVGDDVEDDSCSFDDLGFLECPRRADALNAIYPDTVFCATHHERAYLPTPASGRYVLMAYPRVSPPTPA